MTKEEKAQELGQKYFPNECNIWARPNYEAGACEQACLEMAEWQHEIDCRRYAHVPLKEVKDAWQTLKENVPDIVNTPAVCFLKGADWQKQQMIEKAVEWLNDNWRTFVEHNKEDGVVYFWNLEDYFKKAMEE